MAISAGGSIPSPNGGASLLEALAVKYGASKFACNYLKRYDSLLRDRRLDIRRVIEIGLRAPHQTGSSVHMWEEYFPNARIYGIDINPACRDLAGGRVEVVIFSSADAGAAEHFVATHGSNFDLIIDDGSHWFQDQIRTFRNFFPHLKDGGFYVVEDLVSGDGPHRYYGVAAFKELIDGINYVPPDVSTGAWQQIGSFGDTGCDYVKQVTGIQFYRDLAIIEKGRNPESNPYLGGAVPAATTIWPANSHDRGTAAAKLIAMVGGAFRRQLVPRRFAKGPGLIRWILRRLRS